MLLITQAVCSDLLQSLGVISKSSVDLLQIAVDILKRLPDRILKFRKSNRSTTRIYVATQINRSSIEAILCRWMHMIYRNKITYSKLCCCGLPRGGPWLAEHPLYSLRDYPYSTEPHTLWEVIPSGVVWLLFPKIRSRACPPKNMHSKMIVSQPPVELSIIPR